VHVLLGRLAKDYGFDRERENRLLVAVTEAFTNAVVHGCQADGSRFVALNIAAEKGQLAIEVVDDGAGLAAIPPESTWARLDPEGEGGRGLELMRRLTDKLELSETPGGGLTVSMRYRTAAPSTGPTKGKANSEVVYSWKGEEMELQVETSGGVDIIYVSGRLDLVGSNSLKDEIRRRLQEHRAQMILSLKKVDFINSSGLGAMVSMLKDVRLAGGRLVLSDLAPYVKEIFSITQLSNVFEIYEAEEQARATFGKPVPTA